MTAVATSAHGTGTSSASRSSNVGMRRVVGSFAVLGLAALTACTGGGGDRGFVAPQERSGAAQRGKPPTATTAPARLTVRQELVTRTLYTEGAFSYVEIKSGNGEIVADVEKRSLNTMLVDVPLDPGTYSIRSWQRPCGGACPPDGALDDPTDKCEGTVEARSGETIVLVVRLAPGSGCQIRP